jgi:hypothetical protein
MSGRFFAVPFFLALYLLALWLQRVKLPRFWKPALVSALLGLAAFTPRSPVTHPMIIPIDPAKKTDWVRGEISDMGEYYCPTSCLRANSR